MKSDIKKNYYKDSHLFKTSSGDLETPHTESFLPNILRKELNIWGKALLVGAYTILCLFVGKLIYHSPPTSNQDHISPELSEIMKNLDELKDEQSTRTIRIVESNKVLIEQLEERLVDRLENRSDGPHQIIKKQQEEIKDLKDKMANLMSEKDSGGRAIASLAEKTIPYSSHNQDILRYEHQVKLERLKEKQRKEHEAYVSLHDLNNAEEMTKYRDFKDNQKLKYYELDRGLEQERRDFYRNKYRIVKN